MKLILPLPIPLNQTYKIGNRHMYKSQKALDWEVSAGYLLLPLRPKNPMKGLLCVNVTMFLKYSRDIDSSQKLLFDLLQKMGFYLNDNQVDEMHIYRAKDKLNPRMEVTIQEKDFKKIAKGVGLKTKVIEDSYAKNRKIKAA